MEEIPRLASEASSTHRNPNIKFSAISNIDDMCDDVQPHEFSMTQVQDDDEEDEEYYETK